jgi:hypothetical protein
MWLSKDNKYARKSLGTRSETTAVERGKAAYLEISANLLQGKTYFSITTKEDVQQYVDFRKRDVELAHIVSGRLATIATLLQHWLSFIGKDIKPDTKTFTRTISIPKTKIIKQPIQQTSKSAANDAAQTIIKPITPQPPLPNQQGNRDKR